MNSRERFLATINFEPVDRAFRWEAPAVWPATIKRWHHEGLPRHITCSNITDSEVYDYFEMDKLVWLPFKGGWIGDPYEPMFDYKILEDDGEHLTVQDTDGIVKNLMKEDPDTSMPQFLKFPVSSVPDYRNNIRWRLDPTTRERFPKEWSELVKSYRSRDYSLGMFVIGPFGHLRNLMGDEGLMYALFDEPELVQEIMTHWKNFYTGFISLVVRDVVPDFIMIWEDMCYKSGPLISPSAFRTFMAPGLKEVIDTAKSAGIKGLIVDNDGDCRQMLPIYLDCGANGFYPFEVQAGMDILKIRAQYGKSFTIIGGLDKRTLATSQAAIKAEIDNKVPFMLQQGGYIPMLDHSVPINVPMSLFRYYVDYVRTITGVRH
jgi:uroporphyrinogen-III decarboxylase